MLLLIDNYDSFTYNLYQYLSELGAVVEVFRNDKITIDEIEKMKPERIVISPGPGTPSNAGISNEVIGAFDARQAEKVLGVPKEYRVVTMFPVGVPAQEAKVPPRKELAEIVIKDRWGK